MASPVSFFENVLKREAITYGVNVNFKTILRLAKLGFFNALKTMQYVISLENDELMIGQNLATMS